MTRKWKLIKIGRLQKEDMEVEKNVEKGDKILDERYIIKKNDIFGEGEKAYWKLIKKKRKEVRKRLDGRSRMKILWKKRIFKEWKN